jgi:tetratricopeptide (TPR) repeat protein
MYASLRSVLPILTLAILAGAAGAQEEWVPAQCDIRPGHHLVRGGINHLRIAMESLDEDRREGRLDQAHEALLEAIREANQEDNPAAWYYLGRFYVYRRDAAGADSAFRRAAELAPQCADEARQYAVTLQPHVLAGAIEAWQRQQPDSAVGLFHLASSLIPEDPEPLLLMSMMYAGIGELDSAAVYVERGTEVAGDDPVYTRRIQQATLDLARALEAVAFQNDALARLTQSRRARDTLLVAIARDSAMLAELITQWAGQALRPDVQQAVTRDSTVLEQRLETARAALGPAVSAMANDSTAAAEALAPALAMFERYLQVRPQATGQREQLVRRYSLIGHLDPMRMHLEGLLRDTAVNPEMVTQLGVSIFNDGHIRASIGVLEEAARRNAYLRNALFVLCRAYYGLKDGPNLRHAAERLLGVDPLNPQSVRMMAAAWDLEGNRDSTMRYVALADSGIGWSVTVTQMVPQVNETIINGSVANITPHPLPATTLEFTFLGADGEVLGTVPVEIPALDPRGRSQITAQFDQGGVVAWRYRRP